MQKNKKKKQRKGKLFIANPIKFFLLCVIACVCLCILCAYYFNPVENRNENIKLITMKPFLFLFCFSVSFSFQVYIVGHIPPGSDERQVGSLPNGHTTFSEKNNLRYLRLVRKYSTIILGQFFGHLHSDSFRIIYNEMGKVIRMYVHCTSLFIFAYIIFRVCACV